MYEQFYGLRSRPFSLVPDHEFLYLGPKHKMALSLLEYGLLNHAAFTVITGEPGTGKTTLLNKILDQSQREYTLGLVANTHAGSGSLMPWILLAFGLESKGKSAAELCRDFSHFLEREQSRQRGVLLVVDEAQNLGTSMLEELRLLSNFNDSKRQTLQIILSGQPALRTLLLREDMVQLAQRIAVEYTLKPLEEEETRAYIAHRLRVAGGSRPLFTDLACTVVHRLTGGNPRLINQLCDIALAYGFAEQVAWVTAKLVSRAATDRSQSGILPLSQSLSAHAVTEQDEERECQQIEGSRATGHAETQPKFPSHVPDAASLYAQALAYKQARQFTRAVAQFEQAAEHPAYAFRASVQTGLCLRSSGRHAEAAAAFHRALQLLNGSPQDKLQLKYLLGRSLEALDRRTEALEFYRQIQGEAASFRDVPARIKELSGSRLFSPLLSSSISRGWLESLRRSWSQLLGSSI